MLEFVTKDFQNTNYSTHDIQVEGILLPLTFDLLEKNAFKCSVTFRTHVVNQFQTQSHDNYSAFWCLLLVSKNAYFFAYNSFSEQMFCSCEIPVYSPSEMSSYDC